MAEITQDTLEEIRTKIESVFTSEMEVNDYTGDIVPTIQDLPDKNKGLILTNCTILFVDIRSSTKLSDKSQAKSMAKIYRAFARGMSMCIFSSGGRVRQIAGDRVMGVFVDDADESSVHKAMNASRAIITVIEHIFNPLCKKNVNNKTIGCGVGIDTGRILTASIGMKHDGEDTRDLVWAGKTANVASKHTDLAEAKEIFVTKRFYDKLSQADKLNSDGSESWKKSYRIKGDAIFEGYGILEHYLEGISGESGGTEESSEQKQEQEIEGFNQSQMISSVIEGLESKLGNLLDRYEKILHRETVVNQKEFINESKSIELKKREDEIKKKEEELMQREKQMVIDVERDKNEAIYNVKKEYFRDNMDGFSLERFLTLFKEIHDIGGKLGKSKAECQNNLYVSKLVSYLRSKGEFGLAFEIIINQLTIKTSYIILPNEADVVTVVKKLGKEDEYLDAALYLMGNFDVSVDTALKIRSILVKIGYENKLLSNPTLFIEST